MPFLKLQDRDRQLYYTFTAPQNGASTADKITTIVLIHGLGSSSSYYAPVIPRLVEAGYSCLALDSHGPYICLTVPPFFKFFLKYSVDTDGLGTGSALTQLTGEGGNLETIIDDIGAAISAHDISPGRAVIVGHSMGGIVAPEAALRYNFAGTVLLGPVYPNEALAKNIEERIVKVQQSNESQILAR